MWQALFQVLNGHNGKNRWGGCSHSPCFLGGIHNVLPPSPFYSLLGLCRLRSLQTQTASKKMLSVVGSGREVVEFCAWIRVSVPGRMRSAGKVRRKTKEFQFAPGWYGLNQITLRIRKDGSLFYSFMTSFNKHSLNARPGPDTVPRGKIQKKIDIYIHTYIYIHAYTHIHTSGYWPLSHPPKLEKYQNQTYSISTQGHIAPHNHWHATGLKFFLSVNGNTHLLFLCVLSALYGLNHFVCIPTPHNRHYFIPILQLPPKNILLNPITTFYHFKI